MISRATVAEKLNGFLPGTEPMDRLVDWAETALMDGEIDPKDTEVSADALAKIGLADVREFGLSWEDCQQLLRSLGYRARVEVTTA